MKNFILCFAVIAVLGFTSCSSSDDSDNETSGSDCLTCNYLTVFTEVCDNGDGTYTSTTDGYSFTEDIPEGYTLDDIIEGLEMAGATCE
ncbi:hypothetical protein [Winogradskyella psychrotolerans]|uniref:hypothetical protein n=1 Tax=Winogradskyella psychrotolerans TaxID=1344585 RepID=UPI001C0694B0|nr:hypothetical protein [Winogradskyella psychrotolerans]MBU2926733.1 hypothetical protein [Winogradskyella psychrotolerans]